MVRADVLKFRFFIDLIHPGLRWTAQMVCSCENDPILARLEVLCGSRSSLPEPRERSTEAIRIQGLVPWNEFPGDVD